MSDIQRARDALHRNVNLVDPVIFGALDELLREAANREEYVPDLARRMWGTRAAQRVARAIIAADERVSLSRAD